VRTLEESLRDIVDNAGGDAAGRPRKRDRPERRASFHEHLSFRHFPVEVADYPEIRCGPGVGIGWDPLGPDETVNFEDHESNKPEEKRTHKDLRLVVFQRWNYIIEMGGYTRKEVEKEIKRIEKARRKDLDFEGKKKSAGVFKSSLTGGSVGGKVSGDSDNAMSAEGRTGKGAKNENKEAVSKGEKKKRSSIFSFKRKKGSGDGNKDALKAIDHPPPPRRGRCGSLHTEDPTSPSKRVISSPSALKKQGSAIFSGFRASKKTGEAGVETPQALSSPKMGRRGKHGSVHTGSSFSKLLEAKRAGKASEWNVGELTHDCSASQEGVEVRMELAVTS